MKTKYTFKFDYHGDTENFHEELEDICLTLNADFLHKYVEFQPDKGIVYLTLPYTLARSVNRAIQKYTLEGYFHDIQLAMDFNIDTPIEEYAEYLNYRYKDLLTASKEAFIRDEHAEEQKEITSFDISNINQSNILGSLFDNFDNVVIGEDHGHINPKKLIIDNVEELKRRGVIVVIENFTQELQEEIDKAVKAKQHNSLIRYATPVLNTSYPTESDKKAIDLKYQMVKTLCQHGIPIIAGDVETPLMFTDLKNRQLVGNYSMVTNLEKYLEEHPEYHERPVLYFAGSKHVESEKFIIGIAEKTKSVAFIVQDSKKLLVSGGKNSYHPTVIMQQPNGLEPSTIVSTRQELLKEEERKFTHLIFSQNSPRGRLLQ